MTIQTRIKKLEGILPVNNDPYSELSNAELNVLENKLKVGLYKGMKDKQEASEFKKLFIDEDISTFLNPANHRTREEAFSFFDQQMEWELKCEKQPEIREEIMNYYDDVKKVYKFYRNV